MSVYKIFGRTEKSTDPGHKNNEDNYLFMEVSLMNDEKLLLMVVADGMGGLADGDKASTHALEAFLLKMQEKLLSYYMERKFTHYSLTNNAGELVELIREAVIYANQQVYEKADPYVQTGTTLSVAAVLGSYAVVANIGDSPIYYYNKEREEMRLVSRLQTKAEDDVEKGLYRRYSEIYYNNDHILTKSMGRLEMLAGEDIFVDVIGYINPGDMILVGSDGAFGRMQEEEIYEVISRKAEYKVLEQLFARAREDKADDQSAILYKRMEN
ncbi:MAG: serine/threonine-protein phosphatase [Lachnospiraceae bacterium]|nr:serine/threonine-protein phosphatase [Lachnospiraceae bacterium]